MALSLRRWSALTATFLFGALAACSSSETSSESEPGDLPNDPVVYDASSETKTEVGVAKWGFEPFATDGARVFRAYDAKNVLLVEIRQKLEERELGKTFTMTMTGKAASGSERIEYVAQWDATKSEVHWIQNVVENTFAQGTLAARILARVSPDASALDVTPSGATTGLTTQALTPRDGDQPLTQEPARTVEEPGGTVTGDPTQLIECCCDLTEDTSKMAALAASACALAEAGDDPLASGGNATTESFDLGTEDGLRPRELVVGADGKPQVKSPWAGPYHIVDNHCHDAAAANASKTDGYIACVAESATTSTQGHTINWAPDPTASGAKGSYCAYEPQANSGTAATGSVCCWSGGGVGGSGEPLFDTTGAQDCVKKLCLGQADFPGWFRSWFVTPPKAYPAGSKPLVANDCPGSTDSSAACNTCCTKQADEVMSLFGDAKEKYKQQVEEYRKRCATGCADRQLVREQEEAKKKQQAKAKADAQACLSSALGAKRGSTAAKETCKDAAAKK